MPYVRCRKEQHYHSRVIWFVAEITRTGERLLPYLLSDVMLCRPFDQWYGLVWFAIFGDEACHEDCIRALKDLLVTWDERIIISSIPAQGRRRLFLPIEGEYGGSDSLFPPIFLFAPTLPVFSYLTYLQFRGGEVDRHKLFVVATSEFAILTLIDIWYFSRSASAMFLAKLIHGSGRFAVFPKPGSGGFPRRSVKC